jgi:hypothetical protein
MSRPEPIYSTLRLLDERLQEASEKSIRKLSTNDLKSVVTWLEYRQHTVAYQTATEDDPVINAKGRGKVEMLLDMANELMLLASEVRQEEEE